MFIDFQAHPLFLTLVTASVSIWAIQVLMPRDSSRKLPPGPKGIPFFGNLFQLSATPWKEFEVWKKQHGPLVYIKVAGQGILVLNTYDAASGFLDRKGHVTEDRPRMIVASEIMCGGLSLPLMRATGGFERIFRKFRRAGHEALSKSRVVDYHPVQTREAIIMTHEILQKPNDWQRHFSRTSGAIILSVVYDLPSAQTMEDPVLKKVKYVTGALSKAANPGAHLVEFFPWMKHLPSWLAKWKREAEEVFRTSNELNGSLFLDVANRIKQGDERPSFAGRIIRDRQSNGLTDFEGSCLAGSLFGAGYETTSTVMQWFILAMIAFPEKQKECQNELDAVVGRSRMPSMKDKDNLPYLQATVREILRWRPVTPVGLPHYTKKDDYHDGYFIPKGTICLQNVWSMNRDRTVYGNDADDFNPNRFIDEKGQLSFASVDTRDEGHVAFGFGPRICLGRHMANDSLFIMIASLLWAAKLEPTRDESGKPILPDNLEVRAEVVIRPLPFECSITERFPEALSIVAETRELL